MNLICRAWDMALTIWTNPGEFVRLVERHKDFVDISVKAGGIIVALVAAIWAILKHYSDRKKEREKTELDLRRQAYFELFTAMPLQLEALGHMRAGGKPFELSIEGAKAISRLHLFAGDEALKCIISRNAIYSEGVSGVYRRFLSRDTDHYCTIFH